MTNEEIDRLVAEKVLGLTEGQGFRMVPAADTQLVALRPEDEEYGSWPIFWPSTDLNAAVEAAAGRGWCLHTLHRDRPLYKAKVVKVAFYPDSDCISLRCEGEVESDTPARALSLALLKAVGALPAGNEGGAL